MATSTRDSGTGKKRVVAQKGEKNDVMAGCNIRSGNLSDFFYNVPTEVVSDATVAASAYFTNTCGSATTAYLTDVILGYAMNRLWVVGWRKITGRANAALWTQELLAEYPFEKMMEYSAKYAEAMAKEGVPSEDIGDGKKLKLPKPDDNASSQEKEFFEMQNSVRRKRAEGKELTAREIVFERFGECYATATSYGPIYLDGKVMDFSDPEMCKDFRDYLYLNRVVTIEIKGQDAEGNPKTETQEIQLRDWFLKQKTRTFDGQYCADTGKYLTTPSNGVTLNESMTTLLPGKQRGQTIGVKNPEVCYPESGGRLSLIIADMNNLILAEGDGAQITESGDKLKSARSVYAKEIKTNGFDYVQIDVSNQEMRYQASVREQIGKMKFIQKYIPSYEYMVVDYVGGRGERGFWNRTGKIGGNLAFPALFVCIDAGLRNRQKINLNPVAGCLSNNELVSFNGSWNPSSWTMTHNDKIQGDFQRKKELLTTAYDNLPSEKDKKNEDKLRSILVDVRGAGDGDIFFPDGEQNPKVVSNLRFLAGVSDKIGEDGKREQVPEEERVIALDSGNQWVDAECIVQFDGDDYRLPLTGKVVNEIFGELDKLLDPESREGVDLRQIMGDSYDFNTPIEDVVNWLKADILRQYITFESELQNNILDEVHPQVNGGLYIEEPKDPKTKSMDPKDQEPPTSADTHSNGPKGTLGAAGDVVREEDTLVSNLSEKAYT